MRIRGSESWQIRVDDCPSAFAIALFVRAAAGLVTVTEPPLPPLDEAVVATLTTGHDVEAAARQWAGWWNALVDGRRGLLGLESPDYGLAESPDLRGVVADLYAAAVTWSGDRARRVVDEQHRLGHDRGIEGDVVREAEEEAGRRARPFILRVTVLPLAGRWWDRCESEHILVSEQLRDDDEAYWAVLRPLIDDLL